MIRTHGITHISLAVRDLERSLAFYRAAFRVREYYRDDKTLQVQGPGPHDVIAFEHHPTAAGANGGITHFGFRLQRPEDIDAAVQTVEAAGDTVLPRGEFRPGYPFVYLRDPDGYEIEIWYE